MSDNKTPRTVNLDNEQIEKIKDLDENHPYLQKRGFSWIIRWLVERGLKTVEDGASEIKEN